MASIRRLIVGLCHLGGAITTSLVNKAGDAAIIPNWHIESTAKAGNDTTKLSRPGLDVSTWTAIGSRGTLMGGLLEGKKYSDTDLFFSDNLDKFDHSQFAVPWLYRNEFSLTVATGSHYFLQTNGIASRADIYLNGAIIADRNVQAGAYVGQIYEITSKVKNGTNVLLIQVHPTNYLKDLAIGFVDWNPYPPDNGTGVWRNVEVRQTGPVSISSPRVLTNISGGDSYGYQDAVKITAKVDIQSHENGTVRGQVRCSIYHPNGKLLDQPKANLRLQSRQKRTVELDTIAQNPKIWWPKQWGDQPLYKLQCTVFILSNGQFLTSDTSPSRRFGIRTVTSTITSHNDTLFAINSHPFLVLGAGYTSDIFLRFSLPKLRIQFRYLLDMGLNTVRLEGKQEHPELYDLADEMGIMVLAGWECCDKWEGWEFNDEGLGEKWKDTDYDIANQSMRNEAGIMQTHPSMLGFLVGSDFWPDDRATGIYVNALRDLDWNNPIIASASKRGYPELLGPSGMKMEGPYDWVPPNYWYGHELGAAFGFGSELGAGVGTPEIGSLKRFLSESDLQDLWRAPNKGLYHMSTNVSSFYDRAIYNNALFHRYGAPTSLGDYLLKAQMMDFEATRAQFEAYVARWNAERPSTGLVYWMLNNAWPSLHWNLFDYYLKPAGSYFGTKVGSRIEHVVFDYTKGVYLINRSLSASGDRTIEIEIMDTDGKTLSKRTIDIKTQSNSSKKITSIPNLEKIKNTFFRLTLRNPINHEVLSKNTYWLSPQPDTLDWDNSTWYHTPVTTFANFTTLNSLKPAILSVYTTTLSPGNVRVSLQNKAEVPAIFLRLSLVDEEGRDVIPVVWEDNYLVLWPGERVSVGVEFEAGMAKRMRVLVEGKNVGRVVANV
ncbi:glycoside hydrolase [Delitschia confertaspora ATCC 74209]|uniref:Glycoside hydrolase n=1 Tax=Delitschia confertaspora ATCC 74209 TaxID=1513339 RepID=A0A9P4JFU4_9PLEO|nr:glycoside hydrolase [Delitschia confertaspora ATCC 74209]